MSSIESIRNLKAPSLIAFGIFDGALSAIALAAIIVSFISPLFSALARTYIVIGGLVFFLYGVTDIFAMISIKKSKNVTSNLTNGEEAEAWLDNYKYPLSFQTALIGLSVIAYITIAVIAIVSGTVPNGFTKSGMTIDFGVALAMFFISIVVSLMLIISVSKSTEPFFRYQSYVEHKDDEDFKEYTVKMQKFGENDHEIKNKLLKKLFGV